MASDKFAKLKQQSKQNTERLREQMKRDWLDVVKERMIDIAGKFGIKWSDNSKVKSRRIR